MRSGLEIELFMTGFSFHFDWPGCAAWNIVLLKNPILRVREHCQTRRKKPTSRVSLFMAWFMCPLRTKICPIPALQKPLSQDHHRSFSKVFVGLKTCNLKKLFRKDDPTQAFYGLIFMVLSKPQSGSSWILIDKVFFYFSSFVWLYPDRRSLF